MKNLFGLTENQKRFLVSHDKKNFTNASQTYSDFTHKAHHALRLLTQLSDPVLLSKGKPLVDKEHNVFLPVERFEAILPSHRVLDFMREIVRGKNRSDNDKQLDLYGAQIAAISLEDCFIKLEAQWRAAMRATGERQYDVINNKFQEDKKNILGWSSMILDRVKIAQSKLNDEPRNQ